MSHPYGKEVDEIKNIDNGKGIKMENAVTHIKDFTDEQLKLITETVAKGATKSELQLFLYRAKNLNLDPLKPGQIYFIKYGSGPGTIVVGIEGFRSRAAKTGKLSGIKRGAIKDSAGKLIGAFAEVYRSDWKECAREEVALKEYDTGRGNWQKMPETMIKKVAECAALRMAFPDDLGGVYAPEEMEQAENPIKREQPGPDDGIQATNDGDYRIDFGKFNKRKLTEVTFMEHFSYIAYLLNTSIKDNKAIEQNGKVDIYITQATEYLLTKTVKTDLVPIYEWADSRDFDNAYKFLKDSDEFQVLKADIFSRIETLSNNSEDSNL